MSNFAAVAVALSLAFAVGCTRTYTYAGRSFGSAPEALDAQATDIAGILSSIPPAPTHGGGAVRVLLPTRERIKLTGVTTWGSPAADVVDYIVAVQERSYDTTVDALRRRGFFDSVEAEKRLDVADPPASNADFVLWLALPQPGNAAWYMRAKGNAAKELVPMDMGLPEGAPRTIAWLTAIEAIATRARSSGSRSTADQLRDLDRMRREGLITDEEYERKRKGIIGEL